MILFTDSIYAIATAKTNAEKAAIEGCSGCKVLSIEDTPIGELGNRMGQLTTSLLAKYGDAWTYSIGVNDLYFDFAVPSLVLPALTRWRVIHARSRRAMVRCRPSSASARSSIKSRPSPSRCTCTAGRRSTN